MPSFEDGGLAHLTVVSPRQQVAKIVIRPDTNDAATLHSTFWAPGDQLHDEYGLASVHLGPDDWALDIGAHIGSVALALAMDNPDARVIAVEAVPDNVDMIRLNVAAIGAEARVHVVGEAVGADGQESATIHFGYYDLPDIPAEHAVQVRFIGNLFREHGPRGTDLTVPVVSLTDLLARFDVAEVALTKIDCEGGEWAFLASPSISRLRTIVGEWHDRPASALVALLSATHDVTVLTDDGGIGMFRAERRTT